MKRVIALAASLLLFTTGKATALEVAGVQVPSHAAVAGQQLVLNGAGVRKKFFIKVYVGALYLPEPTHDLERVLDVSSGPRAVHMYIRYKEIDRQKLVDGWEEGFRKNLSPEAYQARKGDLKRFNRLFHSVRKGDVIRITYVPGLGTGVWINDEQTGIVPGDDFFRDLLLVWLGEHPADKGLKEAMLGR